MTRNKDWSDPAIAWESGTGEFDREATIENRQFGGRSTQYSAPKDRKWKARNVVTIHWQLLGIECPYPSMVHIFACVIDHSNINTGRCDVSQQTIALETGYGRNWVRKVLKWVADNTKFLVIEERGRRPGGKFNSHAYHVQWAALELFWIGIDADIKEQKAALRDGDEIPPCTLKGVHGHAHSRGSTDHAHSRGCSNHEALNHEGLTTSLRDHQPSAAGPLREIKEGHSEKECVEAPIPNSPPAKPKGWWWRERKAEAEAQLARATNQTSRTRLEGKIASLNAKIEEMENAQSRETISGSE